MEGAEPLLLPVSVECGQVDLVPSLQLVVPEALQETDLEPRWVGIALRLKIRSDATAGMDETHNALGLGRSWPAGPRCTSRYLCRTSPVS